MGPAGRGWKFQQRKELNTDWCHGSFLPAEFTDIMKRQTVMTLSSSTSVTVQEEPCCEDVVEKQTVNKADQCAQQRLAVLADLFFFGGVGGGGGGGLLAVV